MNANQKNQRDRCRTCGQEVGGWIPGLGWVHVDPRQNLHGVWLEGDPMPADMCRRGGYGLPVSWWGDQPCGQCGPGEGAVMPRSLEEIEAEGDDPRWPDLPHHDAPA